MLTKPNTPKWGLTFCQAIKTAEPDANTMPEKSFLSNLFKYMIKHGWKNHTNLTVRNFIPGGRGVTTTKSPRFAVGDELIRIPLKCMISIFSIEEDAVFKAHFEQANFSAEVRMPMEFLMAFYLLYNIHLKDQSPICGYVRSLPNSFSTPFFCTTAEMEYLPIPILEKTAAQSRKIRNSYNNLRRVLANPECKWCKRSYLDDLYNLEDYKWAYFAVTTRSVYLSSELLKKEDYFFKNLVNDETNVALAPFLDIFNHSNEVETTMELKKTDENEYDYVLTLRSSKYELKPYKELYLNYGDLSNTHLFLEYGFIVPKNKPDCFPISLHDIRSFLTFGNFYNRNFVCSDKFRFIREHDLDKQMFFHVSDGISHNLRVTMHLIFKEKSHFPNELSRVAFGSQFHDVKEEACLLIAYKVDEYLKSIRGLKKLPKLTASGKASIDYLRMCIDCLELCVKKI